MNPHTGHDSGTGIFSRILLWSAFSLLIVAAASGDLWLEEVWSLGFALDSGVVSDIFCRFKHDNNHVLNTLYLYLVSHADDFMVFRTLSVLSGIASLWLLTWIAGHERRKTEATLVLIIAGSSYPLLLYFSEARGYAPAIFFSLVAYIAMRNFHESLSKVAMFTFWLASFAGIIAHTTFIMVSLGLFISDAFTVRTMSGRPQKSRLFWLLPHLPVIAFFAWWYNFYLKDMEIGSGPVFSASIALGQLSVYLLGLPDSNSGYMMASIIFLLLLAAGLRRLYLNSQNWLTFAGILLISPPITLIVRRPPFLYFNYFLLLFPFFYLLLAYLVADSWRRRPELRFLLILLTTAMLIGHWQRNFSLINNGRGNYSAAISHILSNCREFPVYVGSDHDFRNPTLIEYYSHRDKAHGALQYVMARDWPQTPPEYFIGHSRTPVDNPVPRHILAGIGEFELEAYWLSAPVSGFSWYVYRRRLQK
ncbi:MAG: hypothetical protein CVV42_05875 [Candidatus Riflebacteria bacterium HGW-Riflebacteria-2]|jgi:hypothetical protein|nr:MAG: hypothetical protein CVV42_05875 [Candidatus Riflebacteria bacterium HGW-Riflebacteria-2]